MQKTQLSTVKDINRKWWIVDATDMVLGRLISQVAAILRGKHKVTFTPHIENGDHVVIINAGKIVLTGNKWQTKAHHRTSGRPGGLSTEHYKDIRHSHPERILEYAIKGMLPKTKQGDKMFTRVNIYKGDVHPHSPQKPQPLNLPYPAKRGESK
jgi:large subunit ribosomal protein L13